MAYQIIEISQYEELVKDLIKYDGNNQSRHSLIALMQYCLTLKNENIFSEQEIKHLMTDVIAFALTLIEKERGYLERYGSVYENIIKKTGFTKKKFTLDNRLVRLAELKSLVEQYFPENFIEKLELKNCIWENKQNLIDDIFKTISYVKQGDEKRIASLKDARPDLHILKKQTLELYQNYLNEKKSTNDSWFYKESIERRPQYHLLRFLDKTCHDVYDEINADKNNVDDEILSQEINVRSATLLYLALMSGSGRLYEACLRILNVKDKRDIHPSLRNVWLDDLLTHIIKLLNDLKFPESKKILENYWQKTDGIPELSHYLHSVKEKLNELIQRQKKNINRENWGMWAARTTASYASQFFIIKASSTIAKNQLSKYVLGLGASLFASVPTATAVLVGGMIFVSLGVGEKGVSLIFSWMLNRISDQVGDQASEFVQQKFYPTRENFHSMREKLSTADEKDFCLWINTLLILPENIVSTDEKNKIRAVCGIEDGKYLEMLIKDDVKEYGSHYGF